MRATLHLFAAGTDDLLASVPAQAAEVNVARRLIGGLAVPWNVPGMPSTGRTIFRAGSVTVPEDTTWAKLLIEHDPNQSVGYLAQYSDMIAGLLAAYQVAEGPAGDKALADAVSRVRDALSVRVEVDRWNIMPDNTLEVLSSRLRETSLVAVPAYEGARASVLASLPSHERERIVSELDRMLDLTASGTTPAPNGQQSTGQQGSPAPEPPNNAPPSDAGQPGTGSPTAAAGGQDLGQVLANLAAAAPFLAQLGQQAQGQPVQAGQGQPPREVPAGPPNGGQQAQGIATVEAAAEQFALRASQGQDPVQIAAALTDVVPANDAGGMTTTPGSNGRAQWLGELWTARRSDRPYVDALGTPKKLTGLKAQGWRWVTRPAVADYAGNKAAIPSNGISTEPAEATAYRVAGGWDVDRVFTDLGDSSMIQAIFEGATEDYAVKSDTKLGAQLLAAASATVDGDDVIEILSNMAAAAFAIGARVSFLAMAADLFTAFASLTKDEVPWWIGNGSSVNLGEQSGNVGAFSFWVDPTLAAGEFVGGDKRAATFYEEGSTPIRVQALNIPNGGVDLGVFGYNAVIINDDRALFTNTPAG